MRIIKARKGERKLGSVQSSELMKEKNLDKPTRLKLLVYYV